MRFPRECYQMERTIAQYMSHLRPSERRGLMLWVYGTVIARSACQNAVATALLSLGLWNSVRQRLREWLYDGSERARPCNTQLEVSLCFAPLTRWLLSWWQTDQLALAIDATLHSDRLTALVVSVLYRGCAIPVAWHILPANTRGPWIGPITGLLQSLEPSIPKHMSVLVMTDRGLWSPRLWKQIRAQGWHPVMRIRGDAVFQPVGGCRMPARRLIPGPGHAWVGTGTAFNTKHRHRFGTLIVMWDEEQAQPWIVLTDLAPQDVGVSWYGLRVWIELGFRALKGVGWQWQHTRRTDPDRASRHWLVIAVAMLWVMAYGSRAEDADALGVRPDKLRLPPDTYIEHSRVISVFSQGISWMLTRMLKGRMWSVLWLIPEPWPDVHKHLSLIYHPYT